MLSASSALAFSGAEHVDVSNTAFIIAMAAATRECPGSEESWLVRGDFERLLTAKAVEDRISASARPTTIA